MICLFCVYTLNISKITMYDFCILNMHVLLIQGAAEAYAPSAAQRIRSRMVVIYMMSTCIYVPLSLSIYISMYIYIYVSVYLSISLCVYIYIHTHTRITEIN